MWRMASFQSCSVRLRMIPRVIACLYAFKITSKRGMVERNEKGVL